jgi:hypothetical protein
MLQSPRLLARVAGVLYLVTHVTSVTAVAAFGAGALTIGVALELALALGCFGTGVLLLVLLRRHGEVRAMAFAGLRAIEAAVIIAGSLPMLALAWLGAAGAQSADALTQLHAAAFLLGQGLVISVNTLVLAWLLLDARVVPRALALLGLAGGALVLASNLAQLFGAIPMGGAIAGLCAVPIFAFELWFAGCLIVRGLPAPDREPVLAG